MPQRRTLIEVFDQSVERFGPRPLFGTKGRAAPGTGRSDSDGWSWTSYAEFAAMVRQLSAGLAALGVRRGDAVAIVSDNRVEWAVTAYASYHLGAALVPMYQAQSPEEWEFVLRDSGAKVLLVADGELLAKAKGLLETVPTLELVVVIDGQANGDGRTRSYRSLLDEPRTPLRADIRPTDLAGLIYTSGTTGNPKGVMLTHLNLTSNLEASQELVPPTDHDRSLSFLPWAHVFGQTVELHGLFARGASMAISGGADQLLAELAQVKPTVLFTVPRVFNKVYAGVQEQIASKPAWIRRAVSAALGVAAKERDGERLTLRELATLRLVDRVVFAKVRARLGGNLRHAICGGAALSKQVAEFIDSLGIRVYEGYGLTETSPVATTNVPGARKFGSVGRPIPGVRVEIDPATAEKKPAEGDMPARHEGEIVIYGPNVMKGYLKRPSENAAAFTADGGFRTGDIGFLDPHGFLFVTGRVKEQYKLENGKYVVPTPLEEQLKLSPFVLNAMVYGENRPHNVAIVVADLAAVRAWAGEGHQNLPADPGELLRDARVRSLFVREIDKYGASFRRFEVIRNFALVDRDFTAEDGLLTPTMKLRRARVTATYRELIEELYARPGPRAALESPSP